MKLDTGNSGARGLRRAVLTATVAAWGLAGAVTSGLADEFAGLADPTRPAYGAAAAGAPRPTGSTLRSTFVSASQRRAVIGGRTYRVGDAYGGGVITDIQPYEVVVKRAGHETRLRLLPKLAKETRMVRAPANGREEGKK